MLQLSRIKFVCGYERGYLHMYDKQGKYMNTLMEPDVAGYVIDLHPGPGDSVYYTDMYHRAVGCVI